MDGATLADLDLDLALHTALQYSRKLGLRQPTASTIKVFLRELGLLVGEADIERPSIAAVLLFGREPQRFLPHALVTATIDGKKRRVFGGHLLKQRSELLDWLEQPDVNPTLKVKVRGKHEERRAFHERALIELCVNLLVHRDYDDDRPATIEVSKPRSIVRTRSRQAHAGRVGTIRAGPRTDLTKEPGTLRHLLRHERHGASRHRTL